MKLLVVVSSLDLTQAFSATPAWWQLLKGLYEIGVDIIAAPYQGPAIESLWWRAERNPARWQGDAFKFLRDIVGGAAPAKPTPMDNPQTNHTQKPDSWSDKALRRMAQTLVAPRWRRHLERILLHDPDVDAVLFLTVPLNHLKGVPRYISEKYSRPVFYFDGDVPASLPTMQGFASGFRVYQGADVSEYTAFISNSKGGEALLRQLGVENVHTVWYGADPAVFSPVSVPAQDIDVLFYGHGREYRSDWIDRMVAIPSRRLSASRFAVRGAHLGDIGEAAQLPYLSFSKLREYACRSKINLCITRGAHAEVYGSSSSRPFELGAMAACMVANPYKGLEEWFEPEKEIIVVESADEAIERYTFLLAHDRERQSIGHAARSRVLKQHTFQRRARDLAGIIQQYI